MSVTRFASPLGLVKTVEETVVGADGSDGGHRIIVIDAGKAHVADDTLADLESRNITDMKQLCSIDFDYVGVGEHVLTTIELRFHERSVDGSFLLEPAGVDAIDAQQAPSPLDLGEDLELALGGFVESYDPIFTFKGVEAKSMASAGHFTDFEFTYSIDGVSL